MSRILRERLGVSVVFGGQHHSGWLPEGAAMPQPTPTRTAVLDLRIIEADGGFIVKWESRTPGDSGDSWHVSMDDALTATQGWLGIKPDEWTVVADPAN